MAVKGGTSRRGVCQSALALAVCLLISSRAAESSHVAAPGVHSARLLLSGIGTSDPVSSALAAPQCPEDWKLDKAAAVCLALDSHWRVSSFEDTGDEVNENGAYGGPNIQFDRSGEGDWFIESQFYGFNFLQAGMAFDNTKAIDLALKIFNWGFKQQQPDGSFNCPDRYHSSGFFLEATARAALLLRTSFYKAKYESWIREEALPRLTKLADWFLRPEVEREGWENDAPHAHRRYLTGTGLALVGKLSSELTGNKTFVRAAWKYIESGITKQGPSGSNHEKFGYDCSYQGKGLAYAAKYYLYAANTEEQRQELREMGHKGTAWLMSRIDEDGNISSTGNTRTGGDQEEGRNGEFKAVAKRDIVQGLLYWGWILGDEELVSAAWKVERERTGKNALRPCSCRLDTEGKWVEENIQWVKRTSLHG